MMMKDVIIHIGCHKTGTTSLQYVLNENKSALLERNILYPSSFYFQYAQHLLAFSAKSVGSFHGIDVGSYRSNLYELVEIIRNSKCSKVLISSEEWFSVSEEATLELARALQEFRVTIVATIRRPDELFSSIYNQNVKEPANRFLQHYSSFIEQGKDIHQDLRVNTCLSNWEHAFCKGNIIVHKYENRNAANVIGEMLGVSDLIDSNNGIRINKSVPYKLAELVRIAKVCNLSKRDIRDLYARGMKHFESSQGETLLSYEEAVKVTKMYEDENREILERYDLDPDGYMSNTLVAEHFRKHADLNRADIVKFYTSNVR